MAKYVCDFEEVYNNFETITQDDKLENRTYSKEEYAELNISIEDSKIR